MSLSVSTGAIFAGIGQELARISGAQHVLEDPAALANFAIDEVTPEAVVSPGSAEEIAAILQIAGERDWVVATAGGGTARGCGASPERIDVLLRTNRLDKIAYYDPGDLTLGAGAGMSAAAVNRALGEHGQFLPLDVAQPDRATLGGILASASSGPLRHGYGGAREFCIGIQFVSGDGKVAKAGGRVVKNVTGYDLMKLLIGSWGTLGVVTGANFKVFPRARQTCTFVAQFASLGEAVSFRECMARSQLSFLRMELFNPRALEYLAKPALARDPDTFVPETPVKLPDDSWQIALTAAGSDAVLARYRKELGAAVARELCGDEEEDFWQAAGDFIPRVAARHRNFMHINVSVVPAAIASALGAAERAALDNNFLPAIVGRVGMGSFVLVFVPLSVDPPSAMHYGTAVSALRAELAADSAVTVAVCPTEAKRHFDLWGGTTTDLGAMRKIRQAMDPKGILNRGRFMV